MPFHWSWCSSPSPHLMRAGQFRLSVMLVVPLGVVGALLATDLRGSRIYTLDFQVGLLTTIGFPPTTRS
ncbi:efflux RND transporter permease subunit [Shigella flexneri]